VHSPSLGGSEPDRCIEPPKTYFLLPKLIKHAFCYTTVWYHPTVAKSKRHSNNAVFQLADTNDKRRPLRRTLRRTARMQRWKYVKKIRIVRALLFFVIAERNYKWPTEHDGLIPFQRRRRRRIGMAPSHEPRHNLRNPSVPSIPAQLSSSLQRSQTLSRQHRKSKLRSNDRFF